MGIREKWMKLVLKVKDAFTLARHFQEAPLQAMQEVLSSAREGARVMLE